MATTIGAPPDAGVGRIGERRECLHDDGEEVIGRDGRPPCVHRLGMNRRRRLMRRGHADSYDLNVYSNSILPGGVKPSHRLIGRDRYGSVVCGETRADTETA